MKIWEKPASLFNGAMLRRREFLLGAATVSSALAVAPHEILAASSSNRQIEKIGIQLYTVRDRMSTDVPGTLEKIASIGYEEVEFFDYFGHPAAEIKRFIDDAGLDSPSTHISLANMRDTPEQTIAAALTIGHRYIVLGWIAPEDRTSLDDYRAHAELSNRFAEQCHAAGLQYAYHNHDFEFAPVDGIRPIDLFLSETDSELVQIEMDLYWITKGGGDPFAFFDKYPGRFPLCHVKDMTPDGSMADVGDGEIDFAGIFADSEQAGFQHYYVERDDPPDSIVSAANSYSATAKLKF
jgi:sugar phosphate isomerase/epimerase